MRNNYIYLATSAAFLIGCSVIAGYVFNSARLIQLTASAVPMSFNTAFTFVTGSLAQAFLVSGKRRAAIIATVVSAFLPTLTLCQYLASTGLNIDSLFGLNVFVTRAAHPGHMAPQNAACFFFFTASLASLLIDDQDSRAQLFATVCGTIITFVGLIALLGYLFNVQSLHGLGYFPRMAIHTTIGLMMLGSAVVVQAIPRYTQTIRLHVLRRQLLSYSIAGTLFVGIFSSNAGLLPSFSYLERSARSAIATTAANKSIVVMEWAKGLKGVVMQLSSRTVVKKMFAMFQAGSLSQDELQQAVEGDLDDGLSVSSEILGVCRLQFGKCTISAGKPLVPQMFLAAEQPEQFVTGPYDVEGNLFFIAKNVVAASTSEARVTDLYLVDSRHLVVDLHTGLEENVPEETIIAIPGTNTWTLLRADLRTDTFSILPSDDAALSSLLASGADQRGIYQSDPSTKTQLLLGFEHIPSLSWIAISRIDPRLMYAGVSSWLTTAFMLVALVVVVGAVGMFLLLRPLQRQLFVHSDTLEKTIEEKTKEIMRATDFKSQFLANMSHEIRTPLTAILGFADQLQDPGINPSTANDSVHAITRNGKHLLNLINDILDISKIEAGKMEIEHISFSPMEIVDEVVELMTPRALEKDLNLQLTYVFPLPESIILDPTRFRQILLNLVSNAIKFTESGGVSLKVELDSAHEKLRVEVDDTGIGLTPAQISRLFSAFSQADASTTRRFGGTGLGLAITNELATLLGGEISLESTPDVGSRFKLVLPTGHSGYALVHTKSVRTPPAEAAANRDVPSLSGSVLLVEDSEDIRTMVSYLVKRTGARLDIAENGAIAVKLAGENRFDLILMDMQMPVMDGYTATRLLRAGGYDLPIVGVTANTISSGLQKCVEAGCDDALGKPFDRPAFHALLSRYLAPNLIEEQLQTSVVQQEFDEERVFIRDAFLKKLPMRMKKLRELLAAEAWTDIKAEAHRLGGSGLFGCNDITVVANTLERSCDSAVPAEEIKVNVETLISVCLSYSSERDASETRVT